MSVRISTGLRQFLQGKGCMREALGDTVMKLYSGSAPATADAALTGTLLVTLSTASGTVISTDASVAAIKHCTGVGTSGTALLTVNGVACSLPAESTAVATVRKMVILINATVPGAIAIAVGSSAVLNIISTIPGVALTVVDGSTTFSFGSITDDFTITPSNCLQFGVPAAGVMAKAGVWSGVAVATGTAGHFRIVKPTDIEIGRAHV